ncbi:unnamed protein product [Brachionus calyciflorus]|uniref:Uncharacterized protein n=1 Tax=Brachionus calyciflorus TaxID=104777 RepID=A0A813M788_9BILA|nr:unnamed protein product [Brachionus calyciflorus]
MNNISNTTPIVVNSLQIEISSFIINIGYPFMLTPISSIGFLLNIFPLITFARLQKSGNIYRFFLIKTLSESMILLIGAVILYGVCSNCSAYQTLGAIVFRMVFSGYLNAVLATLNGFCEIMIAVDRILIIRNISLNAIWYLIASLLAFIISFSLPIPLLFANYIKEISESKYSLTNTNFGASISYTFYLASVFIFINSFLFVTLTISNVVLLIEFKKYLAKKRGMTSIGKNNLKDTSKSEESNLTNISKKAILNNNTNKSSKGRLTKMVLILSVLFMASRLINSISTILSNIDRVNKSKNPINLIFRNSFTHVNFDVMAEHSAPRKSKTNKKDRSSKLGDRSQTNISNIDLSEERLLNEPYQCTGRLFDDFQILCKQNQISYIPPIIQRPKRPTSPVLIDLKNDKTKGKRLATISTIDSQSEQVLSVPDNKHKSNSTFTEQDENKDSDIEALPKTYILIKDRFEYFKPKIHVELEHPDKSETVTELFIKGWKIELAIMKVLQQALPCADKLTHINLWNCGLTEETFDIFCEFLPTCKNLKNVSFDGNSLVEESFDKLIASDSVIQHLSLRNCKITDIGAEKLGRELGTIRNQNTKLLSLNLSGNSITDNGAIEIARGLRTNRTLLVLNLSGNQIGDLGACKLAETLSRFKMTHEEIVRRRTMKRERLLRDLSPQSRKTNQNTERPPSIAHKSPKDLFKNKKEPSGVIRDRSKSKDIQIKESATDKQTTKTKSAAQKDSVTASGQKRDKSKEVNPKENPVNTQDKNSGKTSKLKGSKLKAKDSENDSEGLLRSISKLSTVQSNLTNESDPLMDETEGVDGELLLIGNRTLLSLNLSRNRITLIGLKEFLSCVQLQISMALFNRAASYTGLLKINLTKNDFSATDENFIKLMDLMRTRDPIANKASESLADRDTSSVISKEGRETTRSKSSKIRF